MSASASDASVRERQIADTLLAMRGAGMDWGQIYQSGDQPWSKKIANGFLLCSLLDYQIPSPKAWANGDRLVNDILGDPDDVWFAIASVSEGEWKSRHSEYKLHRFPVAHLRLWRTGKRVCDTYQGDARRIWQGKEPSAALEALWNVGAGDQIARMIVGALKDCGQIRNAASDVKGDVYVRRVLGRAVLGRPTDAETAVAIARRLHPADPWQLDSALWVIGSSYCKTIPACSECKLAVQCTYALGNLAS